MTNKIGLTGSLYTIPVDPDTETYRVTSVMVAGSERTVDGTLKTDYVAEKRRWRVTWSKLTSAERDLLMTELIEANMAMRVTRSMEHKIQVMVKKGTGETITSINNLVRVVTDFTKALARKKD